MDGARKTHFLFCFHLSPDYFKFVFIDHYRLKSVDRSLNTVLTHVAHTSNLKNAKRYHSNLPNTWLPPIPANRTKRTLALYQSPATDNVNRMIELTLI